MALDAGAHADRQLVGLPRGRLGSQRAGVRRSRRRRQLPEAQLSLRHHDQRQRRALRRRGRRLPQLHLRQVRPRDPDASPASSPGRCSTSKVLHLLRDEYRIKRVTKVSADTLEELVREARRRQRRQGARDHQGLQRRGEDATCRSIPTSRTGAARSASPCPSPTGPSPSRSRRSRPTPSPAASPSPSAASRSTPTPASSTPTARPSPASTRPARLVGGIFYFNYPGGTGLTNGAVFGRIAGTTAGPGRAAATPDRFASSFPRRRESTSGGSRATESCVDPRLRGEDVCSEGREHARLIEAPGWSGRRACFQSRPRPPRHPRAAARLRYAVTAEAPSTDCHAITTYAAVHVLAPHYSLLLKVDPGQLPQAEAGPRRKLDRLARRPDLHVQDPPRSGVPRRQPAHLQGRARRPSTACAIRPAGIVSIRQALFADIASIEAPDPATVVMKLKAARRLVPRHARAALQLHLQRRQAGGGRQFPGQDGDGQRPVRVRRAPPGSHWIGKRFDEYWEKGKPYLDGFRRSSSSRRPW